ncbi:hypothetical protein K435DRAFT_853453 [Dendrothele bispora CBS 962.96]|uniref:Uncharacterized protein n=1 Tax=Dendrothele bispora (strain CBS 962.96) TaxID=1314807 RepID=A0A4S8MGG4_DENBC|nr:hypothetical protein K435DRAFT_853453 [Dendrothele bispora CBS 962.96]
MDGDYTIWLLLAFIAHLLFFPSIENKTVTVQCTALLLAHSVYTAAVYRSHCCLSSQPRQIDGADELNLAAPASGAPITQSASIPVPAVQHPLPRSQTLSGPSQINQPSPTPSLHSPAHSPRSNSAALAPEVLPVPGNVSELTHKLQSLEERDYVDQVSQIVLERVKKMRERRSPSSISNWNAAVKEAAWASLHLVLNDTENTANFRFSDAPAPPAPFVPVTAPALVTSSVPESPIAVAPSSIRSTSSLLTSARPGNCNELLPIQSMEDKYVGFDKVHGAIGQSSSVAFYDEPKNFLGDLKLLHSDQLIRKLAVVTEAQWLHTYDAWCAAHDDILLVPFGLTKRFVSVMLAVHLSWIRVIPSTFLCSLSLSMHLPLHHLLVKCSQGPAAASSSKWSKSICKVNVAVSTKPKTVQPALISSLPDDELVTAERVLKAQLGTRTAGTKCKLESSLSTSSIPRFRQGYVWSSTSSNDITPPSILSTYNAPPLPSPPKSLHIDPMIQSTLHVSPH